MHALRGRSAHVGHAYLTLGNENVRWRTSAALGAVRDAAVHRPLDTCTQATRARARVKVRPQNSHVVKLERCAKLTDLSDLMLADRGGERYVEPQQGLQVIDPKASAAPSWSGVMSATTARSPSDPLDGQCMLRHRGAQAVLERPSEHRGTR